MSISVEQTEQLQCKTKSTMFKIKKARTKTVIPGSFKLDIEVSLNTAFPTGP